MTTFCYFNGKIIPQSKAVIPATDLSILRAYAVFDFLRTYRGKPFLLKEHMLRFRNSARSLGLKVSISDKEAAEIIFVLMKKNKMKEASVRLVLTGGETFATGKDNKVRNFFIFTEEIHHLPAKVYTEGAKLVTYEFQRSFPSAKTTHYTVSLADAARRKKEGALETLLVSNGKVLEATTSNFFMFKKGVLITPKDNILLGMTRNLVIKLAAPIYKIEQRDIQMSEIGEAEEAFITATNKEIVPIVKINTRNVGNGRVGPNTSKLIDIFSAYTNNVN